MSAPATAACEQCKGSFERADLVYCPAGELLCAACRRGHVCRGTALGRAGERRVVLASLGFATAVMGALLVAGVEVRIALFAAGTVLFAVGAVAWGATVHLRVPFFPVGVRGSHFLSVLGLALIVIPVGLDSCSARGGARPSPPVRSP